MACSFAFHVAVLAGMIAFANASAWAETSDLSARVQVAFIHAESFTDFADRYGGGTQDAYVKDLQKHIEIRASNYVPTGARLVISIENIDMAGAFEPWRPHAGQARIVRDIYPPRIDLDFTLTAKDGTVIANGRRELRDPVFLGIASSYGTDPLRYEKAMLDRWLERELGSLSRRSLTARSPN